MKKTHVNIPVFIPHLGCPNMCVFCNQRAISGVCSFVPDHARDTIETALRTVDAGTTDCEIAFFGGSFTGIERELMIRLLDLAEEYVRAGKVSGIRFSTRPDYIDEEIIAILRQYTISAAELGIQSFSDRVLSLSRRGHTAEQSEKAMLLLQKAGFSAVGQMMIGLPGSSLADETECARKIAALGASAARIYPTLVFRETELYERMLRGEYTPLSLEDAVERSAAVLDVFLKNGVACLRIGLCESENLHTDSTFAAGPNHPSLGELVYSELYCRRIMEAFDARGEIPKNPVIAVSSGEISKAVGHKKRNKEKIIEKYRINNIKFIENPMLTRYNIVLAF
ncbi:MAG: radical SAM protein [Clostridia bacterium]|nr:radical SAM protein [Clostridia bacterium]